MDYLIMAAAAVLIVFLLLGAAYLRDCHGRLRRPRNDVEGTPQPRNGERKEGEGELVPSPPSCPVCRSLLPKGVDLYTKVFRPMNVHDQYCIIFGCPCCYSPDGRRITQAERGALSSKGIAAKAIRRCPVCGKAVPSDGYLTARLFNKTKSGKPHITVTGCPNCAKI